MNVAEITSLSAATAATLIALVFLRAAWHKLRDLEAFTDLVANYRIVPARAVFTASHGLFAAEISVVPGILVPQLQSIGSGLAMALLLAYAAAIASNLIQGRRELHCGCGSSRQRIGWPLVVRNLALAGIAALALPADPLSPALRTLAATSGLVLWIGFLLLEQLLANESRMRWDLREEIQ